MEIRTNVKSAILKSKSGRVSYYIRNFSFADRFDVQRLCTEERIEILVPISRACFRNRFTFVLLVLCMIVSMFICSRLLYSFVVPPTLITSFLSYRISKLKHKIKAPFQHSFVEYTEQIVCRRLLVAIVTVEDEHDIMHEQDLIGFICFSTHPTERQSALITHLFVSRAYRHEKIGHHLLQTCRRVISEETQYQYLYALCSGYQTDGYKFLLNHHFFICNTWTTCVFVPGITDEQKMLSTTRLAPL
jgi:N-acetylglutamate synthase-like GNAT family acetyltransferase